MAPAHVEPRVPQQRSAPDDPPSTRWSAPPRTAPVERPDRPGREIRDEVREEVRDTREEVREKVRDTDDSAYAGDTGSDALVRLQLKLRQSPEADVRVPGPALSLLGD